MNAAPKPPPGRILTLEPATSAPSLGDFYDEQVRPRLTADVVYTHANHQWHRSGDKWRGGCPFHTSSSGTSFNVSLDTLAWFCPGCGFGGGPIQYLYRLNGGNGTPRGRDFVETLRELTRRVGLTLPEREMTTAERQAAEQRAARQAALEMTYRICQEELWKDENEHVREYLHSRGLNDEWIHQLGLGYYSLPVIRNMFKTADYRLSTDLGCWADLDGYVTFPWHDALGYPLTLYGRWPLPELPKDGRAKTLALPGKGSKAVPLYFDRLRRAHHQDVVLVEGLLDAAVAQANGLTNVVAYVGAQPSLEQHKTLARHKIKTATICPDPDAGGNTGILSFGRHLDQSIRGYVAPKLPDDQDPDEFILQYGADVFVEHIRRAERFVIYRTRDILAGHDLATDRGRDDSLDQLEDYSRTVADHEFDDLISEAAQPLRMQPDALRRFLGRPDALPKSAPATEPKKPSSKPQAATGRSKGGKIIELPTPPELQKISRRGHRPLTEMGNAERLVDTFGEDLRYSSKIGKFLAYGGWGYWRVDDAGTAVTLAMQNARNIHLEAFRAETADERAALSSHAQRSEKGAAIAATLKLAQALLPISTDDLDQDPWLLNVANGTVDLRTGELHPHRRDDFITRQIDVEYHPDAPCERWTRFLEEVQPEEANRAFLQRAAGYSAVGSARERVLLILYGGGRNGKSVFLQELRTTLGPYAVRMPSETFLAKRQDGAIPNDIAQLRGARLAFGSETGEGRKMAEAKIKEMTGDESISARFLHGEWFDFRPTFTPWLATNHRPVITGSDAAIWDRIRLVPFEKRFRLPDEPDHGEPLADLELAEKLNDEREGILAWIVRGAMAWHRNGLGTTQRVRAATSTYRADMDDLGDFLAERCVQEADASAGSREMFTAFKEWSEGGGEQRVSEKTFSAKLEDRGYVKRRGKAGVRFLGVRLRTAMDDDTPGVGCRVEAENGPISPISALENPSREKTPKNPTSTLHPANPTPGNSGGDSVWQCRCGAYERTLIGAPDSGLFSCDGCGFKPTPCRRCRARAAETRALHCGSCEGVGT